MPHADRQIFKSLETIKTENIIISVGISVLAIMFFIVNSASYLKYHALERNGVASTATVMKVIREYSAQSGKYANNSSNYLLKYKFENSYATNECSVQGEFSTTPKNQACKVSIATHQITQEEYKTFQKGDTINILYTPSDKKTRSMVVGITFNSARSLIINLLLLPFIFLFGRRVLREFF